MDVPYILIAAFGQASGCSAQVPRMHTSMHEIYRMHEIYLVCVDVSRYIVKAAYRTSSDPETFVGITFARAFAIQCGNSIATATSVSQLLQCAVQLS